MKRISFVLKRIETMCFQNKSSPQQQYDHHIVIGIDMDQSLGSSKWSRNLSEDSQSDSNRFRLIERQRQLLESKLHRQHQIIATSTRPPSGRPIKTVVSLHRSCDKLLDIDDSNDSGVINLSLNTSDEPNLTKDESSESSRKTLNDNHMRHTISPLSSPEISSKCINTPLELRIDKSDFDTQTIDYPNTQSSIDFNKLNPLVSVLSNDELFQFTTQPISPQTTLQCTIIRDKKGFDRSFYPTYYLHLQAIVSNNELDKSERPLQQTSPTIHESRKLSNDSSSADSPQSAGKGRSQSISGGYRHVFLLSGRRRKKSKTYLIGNDPFDISRGNCIAKLKSNVLGTQFTAIRINSDGQRYEIGSIIYDTNVLGFKGPRKMTALIPQLSTFKLNSNASLFDEWKRNNKSIYQLKNKTPIWNEESQSYVLNFHGRVTQASVKNFQLILCQQREDITISSDQSDHQQTNFAQTIPMTLPIGDNINNDLISMQFGRVSNSQFTCDVSWPMSLLQAFAISLSSFDSKLACE